mmetsp:Transcript_23236/g.77116  ORF Transcript_23236/g.77116 Transcript_23236/m.77116 type:complete len:357 (+) Transcript_23236:33-1103(+)
MSAPGAPSTAQQAAQTISQAVSRQDGAGLAAALRLDLGNTALIAQLNSSPPLEQICGRALVEPWDELLLEQLHYIKAAAAGEHEAAYSHCERAAACFQAAFEKESDWPVPALHSLCLNLRRAAAAADAALVAKGERAARQQEAARTMQKFFQVCVTDRAPLPVSKKWGALVVINALFHVYFAINNLRLCQNLIRAVEGPAFPKALDGQTVEGRHFAKAEVVTYKYFTGRLALLNSDFGAAERSHSLPAAAGRRRSRRGNRLARLALTLGSSPGPSSAARALRLATSGLCSATSCPCGSRSACSRPRRCCASTGSTTSSRSAAPCTEATSTRSRSSSRRTSSASSGTARTCSSSAPS